MRGKFLVAALLAMLAGPARAEDGEGAVVVLSAEAGDYIEGVLESEAAALDLDLLAPTGRAFRRLLAASSGRAEFRFVADTVNPRVRVGGPTGGGHPYGITVTRRVPQRDWVPPRAAIASPAVAEAARRLAAGEGTAAFWAGVAEHGTPLAEPLADGRVLLTFLVRGARHNAWLVGAPSGNHEPMQQLGHSDIWYYSFAVPPDTRLSYRIAPDKPEIPGTPGERRMALLATAQADPLNRTRWPADAPDAFAAHSLVELPDAPPQPWIAECGAPKGQLSRFRFASAILGNSRDVSLYLPPGYDPGRPDTLLLFLFDGEEYQTRVPTPTILDNLIAAGRLPPVVAVLVANGGYATRARELPGNPAFARALATELLPDILARTGLRHDPARTVVAGSSYGGLAAATVALDQPQAFGNVLAMSGSFWWSPPGTPADRAEHVAHRVATEPRRLLRFHVSAGLFEAAHPDSAGILDTTRHLRDVLEAKGYAVTYRDYAAGHDYVAWRGALADGLLNLFGTERGNDRPEGACR